MRSSRSLRGALGAALTLSLAFAAGTASAQQQPGVPLDRFDPAPAGDRFFGVQSPYAAGSLTPHVMLLLDYAHNPLVLTRVGTSTNLGSIVSNQMYLHLNGGLSLFDRININVDVPAALYQSGNDPDANGTAFVSPSKVQFGDLRLDLRARLYGDYYDPFQIGVGGYIWFPTAPKGSFVGDGSVRGMPQLILGGRSDRVVWSAAGGPEFEKNETIANVDIGTMVKFGAGLGFLLLDSRHLQLGAETSWAVTPRDVQKRTTNGEVIADIRYRVVDDLELGIGAGPGVTAGIGTPSFRGLLMVAYAPEPSRDRDGDGILDKDDACPDVKGVHTDDPRTNGCPISDRDGDGIPDAEDACPDVKGVPTSDPKTNGCPPDRDGDGIIDAEDACPDVKGIRTNDPRTNGCPPPAADRDGDGIPDAEDACPDVKGVRTNDPKTNGCPPDRDGDGIPDPLDACPDVPGQPDRDPAKNGCPHKAVFTEKEILILEQVQFDTGKSTIKKVSDALLDEVGAVLKDHPEIRKLEVQGHTDSRGSKPANKILSQQRADAVLKALVKRGIDKARMTPKGYGQEKPIADNNTEDGRQKNRRVQFVITDFQKK